MYNYHNLNDVEFEELCKDILECRLNTELRIFGKGRDGGVDLTDNTVTHNIVIQVKHYINSSFANLKNSLNKEVEKVKRLTPKKYYVCCGMELTDNNVSEIYSLFSDYMESDKNIITLKEIDEFLTNEKNIGIVRKHYKLWLYASNILSEIYNNDIFIDCESLLADIKDDCNFFVQTSTYEMCLNYLENNRIIMMIGAPGVGKTITSKMLVLYFANEGYRVRYTTNGDISNIKRSLSSDRNIKEIILLDDCLGQCYFNMKDTQENELLSLIKYIKSNTNKLLILNSRITIFNEAKERSDEFKMFMLGEKIKIHTINMDLISNVEKAKIFYNHLFFKKIPQEYYEDIKNDKNYLKIVNHKNYMPRIIDYVTNLSRYEHICPNLYSEYILSVLSKPDDIWKNEFEYRLGELDRAFMSTLYSLTDTNVEYTILKKCYNNRLSQMNIDCTVDNYEIVLNRLNESVITVFDNKGKINLGVINPSINDYLKSIFFSNTLELENVRKSIIHYKQLTRCYTNEEYDLKIQELLKNTEILNIEFNTESEKQHIITSKLCKYGITNEVYKDTIKIYLTGENVKDYSEFNFDCSPKSVILSDLAEEPLFSFYNISAIFFDPMNYESIFEDMDLEELISYITTAFEIMQKSNPNKTVYDMFIAACINSINESIKYYADSIESSAYCENYDIRDVVNQNTTYEEYGLEIDKDNAIDTIVQWVESDVRKELFEFVEVLPEILKANLKINSVYINVNHSEIEDTIDSYLEPSEDDYEGHYNGRPDSLDSIDVIFDRDY